MTTPTNKHRELAQKLFREAGPSIRFSHESLFVRLAAQHLAEFEAELTGEFERAKQVIAEANNSLYGSQGYFLGMEGGFDKYHLSSPIERLKEQAVRLRCEAELTGWKPIDDAPERKDVLLYHPQWFSRWAIGYKGKEDLFYDRKTKVIEPHPTHYREITLPAQPEKEGE